MPDLGADSRAQLVQELEDNAFDWARRDAQEIGGFAFLADAISDAGALFCFGAEALKAFEEQRGEDERGENPVADFVRTQNDVPPSFHGPPCGLATTCAAPRI